MQDSLKYFFNPQGIAIIGASSDPAKLSHGVVRNLKGHGYAGPIYPVNPKGGEILGLAVYPDILVVPDPLELAVVMTPALAVPQTLEQCGRRGVKAVIVITGGFRETGPEGAALEHSLKAIVARYGMRMIGPNCVGVMDTALPLDTTFITDMPPRGHIGFASHSGAICGGTTDWARSVGVGYSRIATLGNQLDVDIADGVRMLADDPNTRVINLYAEGLPDGRRFVEVAAPVSRYKPIVMLKAGLTHSGVQAVASHTGALAGSASAYRAACHRAGALVVGSLQEQNDVAMALATQPLPDGPRVALLTNAGGPAALASDALDFHGLTLAQLSAATEAQLKTVTPSGTQLFNPIDMLGGPRPAMYYDALKALADDPGVDMLLAMFVPQAITPVNDVARAIVQAKAEIAKPVLACMVGGQSLPEAVQILNAGGVPFYQDPTRAGRALAGLWEYRQLRDRPDLTPDTVADVDHAQARRYLQEAWERAGAPESGRIFLDAETSGRVAAAYGIRVPFSGVAANVAAAVTLAEQAGYPVALKLIAPGVVHKADVGGIALGLNDADAVRSAFAQLVGDDPARAALVQQMAPHGCEVILGVQRDAQFGPLLMFGLGGVYVEVFRDVAFRLAPLCEADACAMIAETAAGKLLAGVRGQPPADMTAVVDTLLRLGQLASDFPCIAEMDINPLIVAPAGQGAWAVDVRIALDAIPEQF